MLSARSCVEGFFTLNLKLDIARPVGYAWKEDLRTEPPFLEWSSV